jgi:oligopeptide/dipeptide ABC transporter ATP-binding protein
MNGASALLAVNDLSVSFFTRDGSIRAVENVSFEIKAGSTFALVGQSGCGKTTIALSIIRLLNTIEGKITSGKIFFDGRDLLSLTERQMRKIRGGKIAMVFQQPHLCFNPVFTVANQIIEAVRLHNRKSKLDARADAVELLGRFGIQEPEKRINCYPHQFSSGQLQRIMTAMAILCRPKLLIADEPTSFLDVETESMMLDLLDEFKKSCSASILLITHDLSIAAGRADDAAVMFAGSIVEMAKSEVIFKKPLHPYTQLLIKTKNNEHKTADTNLAERTFSSAGCKYRPFCAICNGDSRCSNSAPPLNEIEPGHFAACWLVLRSEASSLRSP